MACYEHDGDHTEHHVFRFDAEGNCIDIGFVGVNLPPECGDDAACGDVVEYGAFGSTVEDSAYRGRYGWTGREFDVETELQYNRVGNHPDPIVGVWIDEDGGITPTGGGDQKPD